MMQALGHAAALLSTVLGRAVNGKLGVEDNPVCHGSTGERAEPFFLTVKDLLIHPLLNPRLACSPSRMMAWPVGASD